LYSWVSSHQRTSTHVEWDYLHVLSETIIWAQNPQVLYILPALI
jgi:hypothetical protein